MEMHTTICSRGLKFLLIYIGICGLLHVWTKVEIPCYSDHGNLNRALGKPVFSSSQSKGTSAMVVDGERIDYVSTCFHTTSEENPWLVIDLGESLSVSTVVLAAYTAISQLWVRVGEAFDVNSFDHMRLDYKWCNTEPHNMKTRGEVVYIHCEKTLLGRFVLVFSQSTTTLTFCEVEIYEEPVFQPEKWTCILPSRTGPESKLNLARGKPAYQSTTRGTHIAINAVNGDDNPFMTSGGSCSHTAAEPSWWLLDLGQNYHVSGVAITNRIECETNGCPGRLAMFSILVGNHENPFQLSNFQPCAWMCNIHVSRRKYYKCSQTLGGRHVAIYKSTVVLELCEVEVYSDHLNDVSFPSFGALPNLTLLGQEVFYDDDDTTCLLMGLQYPMTHSLPVILELPWDPESRTGQRDLTSNYFCNQRFYVNVTHSSDLEAFVSKRGENDVVPSTPLIGIYDQRMSPDWTDRIRWVC